MPTTAPSCRPRTNSMSLGRSVRKVISVDPGLPKIVVIPKRRMTSKVASRTLEAGTAVNLPSTRGAQSVTMRTTRMPSAQPRNPDFVQSLERGLTVIRAFGDEHRELGLSDVARATGLTRAAARRFLLTLVKLGYVRAADGRFSLRPRVLELGYAYLSSLTLPEVAQPHMEALVAEVNESSSISVLDELDVVYVVRVPTRRIMSITLAVGTRLPAYATSMGRVLLAALTDDELDRRLAHAELQPPTARTATDIPKLAGI